MTSPPTDPRADAERHRELHDLVERSVKHVRAPLPRLLDDARADGVALVRRRRVATGLATAAAVAVVALAVPLAVGAGRDATPDGRGVSPGAQARSTPQVPVGKVEAVGGSALLGVLRVSPPAGVLLVDPTRVHATTTGDASLERARILQPGVTSGQVRASSTTSTAVPSCPGRLGPGASCSPLTSRATGRVVGTVSSISFGPVHVNEVAVAVPGEGRQTLGVANTDDDRWGPRSTVTGDVAPLSEDQLVTLASRALATPLRR